MRKLVLLNALLCSITHQYIFNCLPCARLGIVDVVLGKINAFLTSRVHSLRRKIDNDQTIKKITI